MSLEDVEVVRAVYDALAAGDVDGAVRHVHRDARARPAIAPLEQGAELRGRQAVKQFFDSLLVWRSRRVEFNEIVAAGDRLLIDESWHFRGSQDIELDFEIVDVYTIRDGLIFGVEGFVDRDEAFAAVGLRA